MTLQDKFFTFIGSKWFTLALGIALMCVLPFTWNNFSVVYKAGQVSQFWWVVAVFIINLLTVGMCGYKFMSQQSSKKPLIKEQW